MGNAAAAVTAVGEESARRKVSPIRAAKRFGIAVVVGGKHFGFGVFLFIESSLWPGVFESFSLHFSKRGIGIFLKQIN